jgi:uncharacterized protein YndB with AHSA1/START domain
MTTTTATTTQVYELFIKATPQQVWEAITRPEFIARYFHGARIESSFEPGGPYVAYSPDGSKLWNDSLVIELDPPRRFVHGWRSLYDPELAEEAASRVSWEIEPQEGGVVKLTVVHDELEGAPKTAANVAGGWMFVLSGLKTFLETGEPLTS